MSVHVSVAAIGRMCGFGDHSSFSRAFRLRFGCAPSEWANLSAGEQASMRRRPARLGNHISQDRPPHPNSGYMTPID
ncbi:helix-turn-helix domain-containing protein [Mycetocola sp. CAN_C7]|uniref:helix-turn-helix domain-containing protein n=1 Tax=Mycetocola sp. CAN_C7 TaxID=2787724 RepID=UPI003FA59A23